MYIKAQHEYEQRNYDRVNVLVPKGSREALKRLAEAEGVSLNRYMVEAVEQKSGLKLTLDNALPWMKK